MTSYRPSRPARSAALALGTRPPGLELAPGAGGRRLPPRCATRTRWRSRAGRFVLYDGRACLAPATVRARSRPSTCAIDVDVLRDGEPVDPFHGPDRHTAPALRGGTRAGSRSPSGSRGSPRPRSASACLRGSGRSSRPAGGSGRGSRPSRSRIARPSTSGPTSTRRASTTTPGSPAPAARWPTAARTS